MSDEHPPMPYGPRRTFLVALVVGCLCGGALGSLAGGGDGDVCPLLRDAMERGNERPTENLVRGSSSARSEARAWRALGERARDAKVADPDLDGALQDWAMRIDRSADMLEDAGDPDEQDAAEDAITPLPPERVTTLARC